MVKENNEKTKRQTRTTQRKGDPQKGGGGRQRGDKHPVFTSILEGENYLNNLASTMEKRIEGRWAGLLLEACPQGYRVVEESEPGEFLRKMEDERFRHWA